MEPATFNIAEFVNTALQQQPVSKIIGPYILLQLGRGKDAKLQFNQGNEYNQPSELANYLSTAVPETKFSIDSKAKKPTIVYKRHSGLEGCIFLEYISPEPKDLDFSKAL